MIGRRVASLPRRPWGSFLLLAIALGLVVTGLVLARPEPVLLGLFPMCVGLAALWLGHNPPFVARFSAEGIEVEEPSGIGTIPYDRLRRVWAGEFSPDPAHFQKQAAPIHVQHEGGVLSLPDRLDTPSHEIYSFLARQLSDGQAGEVNPVLAEYVARQTARFGPEQIWTYRAVAMPRRPGRYRKLRAFFLGLLGAGLLWVGYGLPGLQAQAGDNPQTPWFVAGLISAMFGLIFLLASLVRNDQFGRVRRWKEASLVITPDGLAMVQGDVQGEITWPELREVRFQATPKSFALHSPQNLAAGIILRVAGADILIQDLYDRPPHVIHQRLLWASGRAGPGISPPTLLPKPPARG